MSIFKQYIKNYLEGDIMSRLSHSFSVEHAEAYGIDCAILINHFQFWIEQNQATGKNFHDGKTWMYQTQKDIASVYPYWTEDAVSRIIKKLLDFEIIIKGNYNKTPFDKTAWYAFNDEKKFTKPRNCGIDDNSKKVFDTAESRNQIPRNRGIRNRGIAEPIPDTNTDSKQNDDDLTPRGVDENFDDAKYIKYINRSNGDLMHVEEAKLRSSLAKYEETVINRVIAKIRQKPTPTTDIYKYALKIAENERIDDFNKSKDQPKQKPAPKPIKYDAEYYAIKPEDNLVPCLKIDGNGYELVTKEERERRFAVRERKVKEAEKKYGMSMSDYLWIHKKYPDDLSFTLE